MIFSPDLSTQTLARSPAEAEDENSNTSSLTESNHRFKDVNILKLKSIKHLSSDDHEEPTRTKEHSHP